jgi:GNAT superfamily N-acetyltransferase
MSAPIDLEITAVDPADDDELARFHAVTDVVGRHALGEAATVMTLPEITEGFRDPGTRNWHGAWVAREAGHVVGAGLMATSLLDNLDSARVTAFVLPDARRRGIGSAVLAHLEREARERGRTRLDAEFSWPYDLGSDGAGWPGVEFALARGYRLAIGDVQRELRLPVDDGLLADLAAEAAPHHEGYELRTFVGRVPDEMAQSWTELWASLMTEAPVGEKEIEPESADVDAMRADEDLVERQGRTLFHAVAVDPAGEIVAYTDLAATIHDPGVVYQWGTLVRRDARGHRLGLALKVANLQLLQRERDDVRRLVTWNAEVNGHMIAVNERLGFRPVARLGEFQKRLT